MTDRRQTHRQLGKNNDAPIPRWGRHNSVDYLKKKLKYTKISDIGKLVNLKPSLRLNNALFVNFPGRLAVIAFCTASADWHTVSR